MASRVPCREIDAGGEAAVCVNHITKAAGVAPPVLYNHFDSRDGLVIAAQIERYSLVEAVMRAQDEIVAGLVEILEPCRQRRWLRECVDLPSAVAWQHSMLMGRVYVEHGAQPGDPAEWNRLTLEAVVRTFFGD